jgi:hypothetical protein
MKRSANVVMAVMAATAVGATAYTLMPGNDCSQAQPGAPQPQACRGSRSGVGYHSYGSSSRDSSRATALAQGGTAGTALPASTQHGGFGSFARSVGSHFSHGG